MKNTFGYLIGMILVVLLAFMVYQKVLGPALTGLSNSTSEQIQKAGGRE